MKYFLATGLFALGIGIGFLSSHLLNREIIDDEDPNEIRLSSNFKFVNPLLECSQGPNYLSKNSIKPFKPIIEHITNKAISENKADYVSVYFRDLNNGAWFGINESEKFFPASLMKLPLLIHYLKIAENDPNILENEVEYASGTDTVPQFYKPSDPVTVGKTYKIKDLLERAITQSDNTAALLLFQVTDKSKFEKIFQGLGLDVPLETGQDYITVRSYATFFRVLFNASYLNHEYSDFALELLSKVQFKSGLNAKLPPSVIVSHKFGESQNASGYKQLHDCGIVYYPRKPYLICIMTRGENFESLAHVIADISKSAYDEVSRQLN